MKKLIISTMALLVTIGYIGSASAVVITPPIVKTSGLLGTKANAVDIYQTTCSKNAAGATGLFVARIKGTSKGALASIQIHKGKQTAKATDAKAGDAVFSPYATIKNGGEGVYSINVDKNKVGSMVYVLESQCQSAKGKATGQTKLKIVQNQ